MHPLADAGGAGVVGGDRQHVGAVVAVDEALQIGAPQGDVVAPIGEEPVLGERHLQGLGQVLRGGGHELHHAERAGAAHRRLVEAALLACHRQHQRPLDVAAVGHVGDGIAFRQQGHALVARALRHGNRQVRPIDLLGQGGNEGVIAGRLREIAQLQDERLGKIAGVRLGQRAGNAHQLLPIEDGGLRRRRLRILDDGRLAVGADLRSGELAVICGEMLCRGAVPAGGQLAVALDLGGAAGPIGAARQAHRAGHLGVEPDEVVVAGLVIAQEAKRHPAGKELAVGKSDARGQAVAGGEAIGQRDVAVLQRMAHQQLALAPPGLRPYEVLGRVIENVDGAVVHLLAAAPAHALEQQAGIILELARHPGHQPVGIAGHVRQGQPRLGDDAVTGIDPGQHALGGVVVTLPDQTVEPLHLVLAADVAAVLLQHALFVEGTELAGDPDLSDLLGGACGVAVGETRVRLPQAAERRRRREALEPERQLLVADGGDRLLGALAQGRLARPIRVLGDESGDVGEADVGIGPHQVVEANHFGEERILCLLCFGLGAGPVVVADCREGGAIGLPVRLTEHARPGVERRHYTERNQQDRAKERSHYHASPGCPRRMKNGGRAAF